MNIVHAVWERRNLGVESYKMTVTDEDIWESVVEQEAKVFGDYLVVKVPSSRRDISIRMNELGYSFVESQIYCYYDNRIPFKLNNIQQRLFDAVTYEPLSKSDLEEVYSNISKGLFVDDTIAVDPYFSIKLANKRFIGLISDNVERGATIYSLKYKNDHIGFFGLEKPNGDSQFAFIGGIYPKFQNIGFGVLMNYFEITQTVKNKVRKKYSAFSSNNSSAFNNHMSIGYTLDRVEYIFVKHNKNNARGQICGQ